MPQIITQWTVSLCYLSKEAWSHNEKDMQNPGIFLQLGTKQPHTLEHCTITVIVIICNWFDSSTQENPVANGCCSSMVAQYPVISGCSPEIVVCFLHLGSNSQLRYPYLLHHLQTKCSMVQLDSCISKYRLVYNYTISLHHSYWEQQGGSQLAVMVWPFITYALDVNPAMSTILYGYFKKWSLTFLGQWMWHFHK